MAKPQSVPHTEARLPSILELGRALAATAKEGNRFDEEQPQRTVAPVEYERAEKAMALLAEREHALWDLIATMPAKTLGDAAVLINQAHTITDILACSDVDEDRLKADLKKVERMLVSALPIVAEAAGLDLAEMNFDQARSLLAHRFHGVEGLS